MTFDTPSSLDIEFRTGWPDDLRVLLDRYPRETWARHVNLGRLARFWLDIHDGFRGYAATMKGSAGEFREGLVTPERFRASFAPRLRVFLSHLEGHHQIEDFQFFPLFGAAEPRLLTGFEVLEKDHDTIHRAMDRMVETANGFMQTPASDNDRMRFAGDDFVGAGERLIGLLARHLDDEEDLIVPLILERSEEGLGL
ncbi:MAG: hemerythrin domain-containing protein [Bauldia sp.]|nr:hemerythrin domain-containing protein [Bauldia sp.]